MSSLSSLMNTKTGLKRGGKNFIKRQALVEGQRPPQEVEVAPHNGPYLLVVIYRLNASRGRISENSEHTSLSDQTVKTG